MTFISEDDWRKRHLLFGNPQQKSREWRNGNQQLFFRAMGGGMGWSLMSLQPGYLPFAALFCPSPATVVRTSSPMAIHRSCSASRRVICSELLFLLDSIMNEALSVTTTIERHSRRTTTRIIIIHGRLVPSFSLIGVVFFFCITDFTSERTTFAHFIHGTITQTLGTAVV